VIAVRDETAEESELEGIEEMLENTALALAGTTMGAYFANILRMRHHVKNFLINIFTLLSGLFTKFKQRAKNHK
jgi:predicted esterase YcpF (UPF0227 family)